MDDHLNKLAILLVVTGLALQGCGESSTNTVSKGKESTPALNSVQVNSPQEVKPSVEELKQREIEAQFKEFIAAQEEPDPAKWKQRYETSFELLVKHGKDALPVLINALKDKNQRLRESASIIISAIGPSTPEETGQFLPFLNDESEMVRVNIVACLSLVPEHTEVSIEQLKSLLQSKDQSIKGTAAGSAVNLSDKAKPLADELIEILDDSSSPAFNLAFEALSQIQEFSPEQQKKLKQLADQEGQPQELKEKIKTLIDKTEK